MNKSSENLEVEVKFHLDRPEIMHQRLVALDAVAQPRGFETNLRFEDDGHSLKANNKLLRLRRDKDCRLTYKSKPSKSDSQCKVYRELEVTISNFDTMREILHGLGYHTAQVYEKWRQTFCWKDVQVCLDTMPYGSFLEIEGPEESIKQTARHLGLPWEKRILNNYLAIFEMLCARYNLPFHDVTFENFENHPVDITPLLKKLEVGS